MTALKNDFDEFLHAPIGADASGMPMTMLSALARLDVDPWAEAASLARLPLESATQRLVSLLTTVPNWRVPQGDDAKIAALLIGLLHRSPSKPVHATAAPREPVAPRSKGAKLAVYYLIALIFMLVAYWATAVRHPPGAMDTRIVPVSTD